MWVGTNNGLAYLNLETNKTEFYDKSNSGVKYGYVTSLFIRANGDLIFSQGSNGITYYNKYTWPSWGSMLSVKTIAEDKDHELWMGGPYSGIEKTYYETTSPYAINRFSWRTTNSPLPSNDIPSLQFDKKGNLWIVARTSDESENVGGVLKYDGENWITYNKLNSPITTSQISCMVLNKNDEVWIGTDKESVYKFADGKWIEYSLKGVYDTTKICSPITSLAVDSSNTLWAGTRYSGIYRFDGETWKIFDGNNSSLRSSMIFSLAVDYKGRVWAGTEIGLYRFDGSDFQEINITNSELPSAQLLKSTKDSKGNIFFISEDYGSPVNSNKTTNGIVGYNGTEFKFISTQEIEKTVNRISAITSDLNDNIWFSTPGRLYKMSKGEIIKYEYNYFFEFYPQMMCADCAGNIWIVNGNGNIIKFDGIKFTTYRTWDNPLFQRYVSSIQADGVNVWVSFHNNESRIGKINIARSNNNLIYETIDSPFKLISSAQLSKNGNYWIGSYNEGIASFDGSTWKIYNTSNSEIMTNQIYALYVDEKNRVFASCLNSFDPYNKGGLGILSNGKWENLTYNNSGLRIAHINSITSDKNGNIWNIGHGGVSIYNPDEISLTWDQATDIQNQFYQNFPNPFNSSTIIKYSLARTSGVQLKIFDMVGREVKTLIDKIETEGNHFAYWDGRNNYGSLVSSGVYIYTLRTNEKVQSKKLILMK